MVRAACWGVGSAPPPRDAPTTACSYMSADGATLAGFVTFLSFTVFGLIPLLFYCGLPLGLPTLGAGTVFILSCVATGIVLFVLGIITVRPVPMAVLCAAERQRESFVLGDEWPIAPLVVPPAVASRATVPDVPSCDPYRPCCGPESIQREVVGKSRKGVSVHGRVRGHRSILHRCFGELDRQEILGQVLGPRAAHCPSPHVVMMLS